MLGRSRFRLRFESSGRLRWLLFLGSIPLAAQTAPPAPPLTGIQIMKRAGSPAGDAVVFVNGKMRRVESHAYQVWSVDAAHNALLLIRGKGGASTQPVLQYLEGDTRKRRDLGSVSLTSGEVAEARSPSGESIYVLHGISGGSHVIVVAGADAIHGRLQGKLIEANERGIRVETASGKKELFSLDIFAGSLTNKIYRLPTPAANGYFQLLKDGSAVVADASRKYENAKWYTDGHGIYVEAPPVPPLVVPRDSLETVSGIPAGARLTLRLMQPLFSNKAKSGDAIEAELISPATVEGITYLPQGAIFSGKIQKAHGVGWGVGHETASLKPVFSEARLPGGGIVPLQSRVFTVENAQEKVDSSGTIHGIRSTGTWGHSAESKVGSVSSADPVGYLFSSAAATAALGFAEPEILYSAGTEMLLEITAPVVLTKTFGRTIPNVTSTPEEDAALARFVRGLPFRTATAGSNKPSDLTNLLFIGSQDGLRRAFQAAGWLPTDELNAESTFSTVKTLAGNQSYRQAPMSVLLLDERPPFLTLSKTTNTFSSRHHLRLFNPNAKFEGVSAYTASSTQDIGIGFSRAQKTFIHVIDQYIDNERTKVVNDLEFTGCVAGAQLVPRPFVPTDAYNSTGDRLRTDGAIAVLRITDCNNPRGATVHNVVPPNRFERIVRDTALTLRNDLYRGNLIYQGVSGSLQFRNYWVHRNDLKADPGAWRKSDLSGTQFEGTAVNAVERQPAAEIVSDDTARPPTPRANRWEPPRYEIALHGGYLRYPTLRTEAIGVSLTPLPGFENLPTGVSVLADEVDGGWVAGISLTLNTWRWVSNEFSYFYQRGKYNYASLTLGADPSDGLTEDGSTLVTRQFSYNVLVHARPATARWRPYVAAGPVLQLLSLTDAVLKKPGGPFRLGLQNIGIIKAAFDFGSTPPLEGGGIFQLGLQYGGGIKVRVLPRFTIRADFRETWTPNPQFLRDSYTTDYFDTENYRAEYIRVPPDAKFRQQRITLGFAFTF